jgi:hypothetical protein
MPPPDPTQAYLTKRGVRPELAAGGLAGLLDRWAAVIASIQRGYDLTLDDYLNDMDLRQLIEDALPHATVRGHKQATVRLYQLDEEARALLKDHPRCLWGPAAQASNGWTPERNWWYFSVPAKTGPTLRQELDKG